MRRLRFLQGGGAYSTTVAAAGGGGGGTRPTTRLLSTHGRAPLLASFTAAAGGAGGAGAGGGARPTPRLLSTHGSAPLLACKRAQLLQLDQRQRRPFMASAAPPPPSILGEPLGPLQLMPFGGVMLDTDEMQVTDTSDFSTRLVLTVNSLKKQGKSSMWVRVHALNGHLLAVLGTFGFRMHHCEAGGEAVIMNSWLQPNRENKIPPYATHLLGVAGFVMNDKKEVLLVKEESKAVSGWKLPGGYTNMGEELGAAACREVEEETGIKSVFESVLAIRHQHKVMFGVSDLYVVARLRALTNEIKICPSEILDARWVPLSQFKKEVSHPLLKMVAKLAEESSGGKGCEGDIVETEHPSILAGRPPYKLYHAPVSEKK